MSQHNKYLLTLTSQLQALLICLILTCLLLSCKGQSKSVDKKTIKKTNLIGGAFENNEFTYYEIPKTLSSTDTSSAWNDNDQKVLLTDHVFKLDAKTPASNILLYYYHTNAEGRYLHKPEIMRSMPPNEFGQTHGYIRGWVMTDSMGSYKIYTTRPGVYSTRDTPAHIHVTIKEPNDINEYYIDDFVFDDDPLVNEKYRSNMENRCGSGVVNLFKKDNLLIGERNIILGLNIPNYPAEH